MEPGPSPFAPDKVLTLCPECTLSCLVVMVGPIRKANQDAQTASRWQHPGTLERLVNGRFQESLLLLHNKNPPCKVNVGALVLFSDWFHSSVANLASSARDVGLRRVFFGRTRLCDDLAECGPNPLPAGIETGPPPTRINVKE